MLSPKGHSLTESYITYLALPRHANPVRSPPLCWKTISCISSNLNHFGTATRQNWHGTRSQKSGANENEIISSGFSAALRTNWCAACFQYNMFSTNLQSQISSDQYLKPAFPLPVYRLIHKRPQHDHCFCGEFGIATTLADYLRWIFIASPDHCPITSCGGTEKKANFCSTLLLGTYLFQQPERR